MSELHKALQSLPPIQEKKHFVTIDGIKMQVSLQKKLEIQQHGEDRYMLKGDEIIMKPIPKAKTQYPILKKAKKGFVFEQDDIHWPKGVVDGGEAWLIEQE